ncbi:hypothetical protein [Pedobacter sp. SG908]|uniref:hypothetical protein n=1 Tax=Pedobacter sp. SG908 TaxID=2587135 RepID=UPI00142228BE|nr:hypothetical protein [Pedobacter sp. SG908]NII83293.1 hypothetical protein [Pedobacter sp. SG908]
MKTLATLCFAVLCINSFAQETLQSVTDRGTETNKEIQFRSVANPNKYAFAGGNLGYARIGAYDITTGFDNLFIEAANVSIGHSAPRAVFDITKPIPYGALGAVLGRLPEGDDVGNGTFLGTQGHNTNALGGKSFSIVHNFYGQTNSSINFHRGGDITGGFISFSTNANEEKLRIDAYGNVGIGTTNPTERLSVNGKIRAKEIKVEATNWPDYVFEEGYKVETLEGLESYIKENKHLPEIPSAKLIEKEGLVLGEMNKKLLKNLEELTLHVIELNKRMEKLEAENQKLKKNEN